MRCCFVFLLTIFLGVSARQLAAKASNDNDDANRAFAAKLDIIAAPMPAYPFAARVASLQGRGIYQITFDPESGLARKVTVLHSTGYALLDQAAIDSLSKWRIKAHRANAIKVPVNFGIEGETAARLRGDDPNVLYAVPPHFPVLAAGLGVNHAYPRHGRFQLYIDPSTGRVTDVKILETTGLGSFDTAAVRAFRQWRFRPRTLTQFVIPMS